MENGNNTEAEWVRATLGSEELREVRCRFVAQELGYGGAGRRILRRSAGLDRGRQWSWCFLSMLREGTHPHVLGHELYSLLWVRKLKKAMCGTQSAP